MLWGVSEDQRNRNVGKDQVNICLASNFRHRGMRFYVNWNSLYSSLRFRSLCILSRSTRVVPKNNLESVIVNPIPMLRALRHCFKSRLSLYNVIPPIGAPIQNFQNHDLNVWKTLQNIKESERGVLHITAYVSRTELESCSFLGEQASTSQQTKSRNIGKVKKNSEEKMKQEKGAEDMSWLAQSSLSDSEVEFSIDIGSQVICRYSPSDAELSSDSESLRV